jgi:hypothetical protein
MPAWGYDFQLSINRLTFSKSCSTGATLMVPYVLSAVHLLHHTGLLSLNNSAIGVVDVWVPAIAVNVVPTRGLPAAQQQQQY